MLIDGNLIVNFSRSCAESNIDSVETLKNKLNNVEFMKSEKGQVLSNYIEQMIAIASDLPVYKVDEK
ncbi:MAG: hypothetical protein GX799_09725 [Crenarchaeota archaeon]|jgi:hypothetical protein|nr:hypothetical protein [Thermoproteota archaeon]